MFTVVKFCRHRAAACWRRVKVREGPDCIKPPLFTLIYLYIDIEWIHLVVFMDIN